MSDDETLGICIAGGSDVQARLQTGSEMSEKKQPETHGESHSPSASWQSIGALAAALVNKASAK